MSALSPATIWSAMPVDYVGVPSISDYVDDYGIHKWWLSVEQTGDGRTFPHPNGSLIPATALYASKPVFDESGMIIGRDRFELTLGDEQRFRRCLREWCRESRRVPHSPMLLLIGLPAVLPPGGHEGPAGRRR